MCFSSHSVRPSVTVGLRWYAVRVIAMDKRTLRGNAIDSIAVGLALKLLYKSPRADRSTVNSVGVYP